MTPPKFSIIIAVVCVCVYTVCLMGVQMFYEDCSTIRRLLATLWEVSWCILPLVVRCAVCMWLCYMILDNIWVHVNYIF